MILNFNSGRILKNGENQKRNQMISKDQQYEIISRYFQSFRNGKISKRVSKKSKDYEYFVSRFKDHKFATHTLDNFKAFLIYALFFKKPTSKIDLIEILNNMNSKDILKALKFKNTIVNYDVVKSYDEKILSKYQDRECTDIWDMYAQKRITIIGLYEFCKNKSQKELKGKLLKKEIQDFERILMFFNGTEDPENSFEGESND